MTRLSPFTIALAFLLLLCLAIGGAILQLNGGFFTYTQDDPYIHLAMAEQISLGHYGINAGETSSPSSSILWPILLAPLAGWSLFPLLLNLLAAAATLYFISLILNSCLPPLVEPARSRLAVATLCLLIIGLNLVGLIFLGMEHSLQVLLVVITLYGLIREGENGLVPPWLGLVLVLSPLVRYENLAISGAAALYLILRGHTRSAVISLVLIALLLGGFSAFLLSEGQSILPASVTAKSTVVNQGGRLSAVFGNLSLSLSHRRGVMLLLGLIALSGYGFFAPENETARRSLALSAVPAIILHIFFGAYDWFNRYEIYIWSFMLLLLIHLWFPRLAHLRLTARFWLLRLVVLLSLFTAVTGAEYIKDLFILPLAANNIYEQQYQMHRFATEFYQDTVAVNDLGWVAYGNPSYVLDLWGLGSREAFEARRNWHNKKNPDWIQRLTEDRGVHLVMIYSDWFPTVPADWIPLGILKLGRKRVAPARSEVIFYATDSEARDRIRPLLESFSATLPGQARFLFEDTTAQKSP